MSSYIDKIMSNHVFHSESSEDLYYLYSDKDNKEDKQQIGGAIQETPNGGFPPIFIIDAKEKEIENSKIRQIVASKSTVSIKDILANKKK